MVCSVYLGCACLPSVMRDFFYCACVSARTNLPRKLLMLKLTGTYFIFNEFEKEHIDIRLEEDLCIDFAHSMQQEEEIS